MKYLKDEAYYSDLYDLLTIKDCLRSKKSAIKVPPKKTKNKRIKPISLTLDFFTYYVKGERYRKRSETIDEWIRKDRERDEKVESAVVPEISCDYCMTEMGMTLKDLHHDDEKVMFWFECPKCKKRKAVFDNGQEYKPKPSTCPKCFSEVKETFKRKGGVLTIFISCPNCKYKKKEVMDFDKDSKERKERQRKDRELLKKYRAKYCMTEKEGQEYIGQIESMKQFTKMMKELEAKQKDPAYKKARKIKKLKVNELKKRLEKVLVKDKYQNLQFDKPEIGRFVVISFTLEDVVNERGEYDSRAKCRRIIKTALEKTNWRLMSEGISYRLGYLSGRLKGYENEDDIAKLFMKNKVNR